MRARLPPPPRARARADRRARRAGERAGGLGRAEPAARAGPLQPYPTIVFDHERRVGPRRARARGRVSAIDADQGTAANAAVLRHEILALTVTRAPGDDGAARARPAAAAAARAPAARARVRVMVRVFGALPAARTTMRALQLFGAELEPRVARSSRSGPHGGSWIANDLCHTTIQRWRGVSASSSGRCAARATRCSTARDARRRAFMPRTRIPCGRACRPACLASSATNLPGATLSPVVECVPRARAPPLLNPASATLSRRAPLEKSQSLLRLPRRPSRAPLSPARSSRYVRYRWSRPPRPTAACASAATIRAGCPSSGSSAGHHFPAWRGVAAPQRAAPRASCLAHVSSRSTTARAAAAPRPPAACAAVARRARGDRLPSPSARRVPLDPPRVAGTARAGRGGEAGRASRGVGGSEGRRVKGGA